MAGNVISKVTLFITAKEDKRHLGIIMFLNIEDFCEENYMLEEKLFNAGNLTHLSLNWAVDIKQFQSKSQLKFSRRLDKLTLKIM